VLALHRLSPHLAQPLRLLVTSSTNTAVDRAPLLLGLASDPHPAGILLGLLDMGFTDFIRVGSLRKIAKQVLGQSLHRESRTNKFKGDEDEDRFAVEDLRRMLAEAQNEAERASIQAALDDTIRGGMKQRAERLRSVFVVGATCAAASFRPPRLVVS